MSEIFYLALQKNAGEGKAFSQELERYGGEVTCP
jgi:hypothetical protein